MISRMMGEGERKISNERIVYQQVELCKQATPSWGRGDTQMKPIWRGLRQKPNMIPRRKEVFFGIKNQFGIDLLEHAKTIIAKKLRRQVLDVLKLRDSLNFVLNDISTEKCAIIANVRYVTVSLRCIAVVIYGGRVKYT